MVDGNVETSSGDCTYDYLNRYLSKPDPLIL